MKTAPILAALALLAPAGALAADGSPQAATQFLRWVYSHYPAPSLEREFDPTGRRMAPKVFDPEMVALIREDERLTPKGDVGALDFDPICQCQDDGGMRAQVQPAQLAGPGAAKAVVLLRFGQGVHAETNRLVINLRLTGAGWRIDDISAKDEPSLKRYLARSNADARKRR